MARKPKAKRTSGGQPEGEVTAQATQRPKKRQPTKRKKPEQSASTTGSCGPSRSPPRSSVARYDTPSTANKAKLAAKKRMRAGAPASPDRSQPKSGGMSPQSSGVLHGAGDDFQGGNKRTATSRKRAAAPGSPERSQPKTGEVSPGVAHGPADSSPDGVKQASALGEQEKAAALMTHGRPPKKTAAKRAGASDAPAQEVEEPSKPARATKKGRAATTEAGSGPPSAQPSEEGPRAKRCAAPKSSKASEKASAGSSSRRSQSKQAARSAAAPAGEGTDATAAVTDAGQGPSADQASKTTRRAITRKPPTKGQANSPSLSGANQSPSADEADRMTRKTSTKKLPKKGRTNSASQSAGQQAKKKPAAKARPAQKRAQKKEVSDDEVASNASDSSYKVPRGLLQKPKCRRRLFDDCIQPSYEEHSESDSEGISNASISSIIPPAGVLHPCHPKKRRLMGDDSGDSSTDDETDHDVADPPRDGLLSWCEAVFGSDTLPNSTTTKAEAVSMLVSFVSSHQLRFGALDELLAVVNKLFAPAENVLPGQKELGKMLAQMF